MLLPRKLRFDECAENADETSMHGILRKNNPRGLLAAYISVTAETLSTRWKRNRSGFRRSAYLKWVGEKTLGNI